MRRTFRAWAVALTFAAGAFVAVYRGPGWHPLRAHGGDVLATLLVSELPKRRAVLESRLRRIEQFAEDADTRRAAERLRRRVTGRPEEPSPPPAEAS